MDKTDIEKGAFGAKYLQMDKSTCFLENAVFVVEVPVLEYKRPEVKEVDVSKGYIHVRMHMTMFSNLQHCKY